MSCFSSELLTLVPSWSDHCDLGGSKAPNFCGCIPGKGLKRYFLLKMKKEDDIKLILSDEVKNEDDLFSILY